MKIIVVTLFMIGTVALASAQVFGRGPQAPRGHAHMNGQEQGQRQGQGQGQPQQNSQQARRAQEMVQRCQMTEHATDTDMDEFSQQRRPSERTGKCLHACLMETVGLISDGKFSVESSVRFMSQMAQGNNELLKIIEEISNDCVAVTDDDRCEMAFKIMNCTEEGIRKRQDEMRKYMPRPPQ